MPKVDKIPKTVIEFAVWRIKECDRQGEYQDARYWAAYLDGARAQKREDDKHDSH